MENVTNTIRKNEYIQNLHDMVWWIKINNHDINKLTFDQFLETIRNDPQFSKIFNNDKDMNNYKFEELLYIDAMLSTQREVKEEA